MSYLYDEYLYEHRNGVMKAYNWIEDNIPEVLCGRTYRSEIENSHDASKNTPAEYGAYDDYFYGSQSYAVVEAFKYAWLHHIHNNPHHWQYWVLINDDDGTVALEMPHRYVIEMICDWWSFSFNGGDLTEIFTWYDAHKDKMILHDKTRALVNDILAKIKEKIVTEDKEENHEELPSSGSSDE